MNEDLLKMQSDMIDDLRELIKEQESDMIDDLRKLIKEQELEIEHLVGRKLELESQVRILTKNNSNLNY